MHESEISWGYGSDADVRIEGAVSVATGSRFVLSGRFGTLEASLPFAGDFNISNAAAAAAAVLGLGMPLARVVDRLASAPQVPGRMERIVDTPFQVLRDYSHTPDALERALATLRPITVGRLVVLFGCGGERDKGKRPMMGKIAVAGADHVIVTSDNPRGEDPELIIDEIVTGMSAGSFERMSDRRQAIAHALGEAAPGDTILLAGKGHEDYHVIGTDKLHFDEREIVARPAPQMTARFSGSLGARCPWPRGGSADRVRRDRDRHADDAAWCAVRRTRGRAIRCARIPGSGPRCGGNRRRGPARNSSGARPGFL